jgi:two-component system, NtrC family, response regulator HydG
MMNNPANILVVDDNTDLLNTFALILKRKGYMVDTAQDGREALEKFLVRKFDAILMDVIMPNMDGIEAMHRMREINPSAKVVLMTAYCEKEQFRKVLNEGAYGALYKPVNITQLMGLLGEMTSETPPILVVDDDDNFRLSLASMLELQKFKVITAGSGEEAIKIAQERRLEIAFIDIKMSMMDGLTTSLKLKEIRPDMLIVMMTGYRDEVREIMEIATEKGIQKCLYKPFNMEEVKEVVCRAI